MIRRVQQAYGHTAQLVARFRQITFNKTFGLRSTHDGKLYFKRPGKVRLDFFSARGPYGGQVAHSLLLNGNTLLAVDVLGKWYFESTFAKDAALPALLFLTNTNGLSTDFHARLLTGSKRGAAGDAVFELTPRTSAARFKSLVLVVDRTTFRVKKSIVTSATGDTSELRFFEPDTSRKVADSWFVFHPKAAAARGFRAVKAGHVPAGIKPRPTRAAATPAANAFLSHEWFRAYFDCDEVRRAQPPLEHPLSLAEMRRCAFPSGKPLP